MRFVQQKSRNIFTNFSNDQTFETLAPLGIMGDELGAPLKTLNHHCNLVPRGSRGPSGRCNIVPRGSGGGLQLELDSHYAERVE